MLLGGAAFTQVDRVDVFRLEVVDTQPEANRIAPDSDFVASIVDKPEAREHFAL